MMLLFATIRWSKKFSDTFSRFDTIPAVTDSHPASHVAVAITLNAKASSLKMARKPPLFVLVACLPRPQPRTTPTALIFDWISFILVYSGIIIIIMDIFVIGLCILSLLCALIYKRSTHPECRDVQFSKFKKTYLFVYLLATGRTQASVDRECPMCL